MRYLVNYILVAFLGMSFLFSGCEASDFEFDSGGMIMRRILPA